ncbi:hypothetical protein QBC36DRAFT_23554 [Triangularia setosa]|uniref:Uncharacterized protein n=1 Tax=Triangularia setosa TaxID=2587417 RepID=A0AAN7AAY9_9PEZI|nr:hypothetical protein QBC36DRAFT_23554 [Podospora setosa]
MLLLFSLHIHSSVCFIVPPRTLATRWSAWFWWAVSSGTYLLLLRGAIGAFRKRPIPDPMERPRPSRLLWCFHPRGSAFRNGCRWTIATKTSNLSLKGLHQSLNFRAIATDFSSLSLFLSRPSPSTLAVSTGSGGGPAPARQRYSTLNFDGTEPMVFQLFKNSNSK